MQKLCSEKDRVEYVGVFCGADNKIPELFKKEAYTLGRAIGQNNYNLVTGASRTGLMNEIMNGFIDQNGAGQIKGIIPSLFKDFDVHHQNLKDDNLIWTDTFHQRLQLFQNQCDVMIVLPGGFGTLHELMDFLVSCQFGQIRSKIILFNMHNFWDFLLHQFIVMVQNKTLIKRHLELIVVVSTVAECMEAVRLNNNAQPNLADRFWEI